MDGRYPSRIVCLTEEPTEVLYALGEEARIVGISGFTVRPARARREKPRVCAFTSAKVGRILAFQFDSRMALWSSSESSGESVVASTSKLKRS